ncbi:MAG: phosphoadenylyl-sulfate reductase [Ilumatobacteraceae bacterium]
MLTRLPPEVDEHDAVAILEWAERRFQGRLVFTCSFEDPVLVHLLAERAPSAPIVLLDPQYLFSETIEYVERLRHRIGFDVAVVRPGDAVVPDELWRQDLEECCRRRKVEPLQRALEGAEAWITGVRRVDGPTRAATPAVAFDAVRGVTKINPLVAWSDEDLSTYASEHDLPMNPLVAQGYPSIGCWPCTRPVAVGEDRRAGRWSGAEKTECGLHLS